MVDQTQQDFLNAVVNNRSHEQLDFITANYTASEAFARFNIYRQNIFENLKNALMLTFPGIWKLVGEECANSVAYAFIRDQKNWPLTGCLDDWGAEFPNFLSTIVELHHLDYIKDFACYEWLCHQAYCASDTDNIMTVEQLAAVPEELIDSIKFKFMPACYLYQSTFAIQQIEEVVVNPTIEQVNLPSGGAYGVIVRDNFTVKTHWLKKSNWLFIQDLYQGASFGAAAEARLEEDPDFNLCEIIRIILEMKCIAW